MQWVEQEIETAHRQGVSHPENLPFLLAPANPNGRAVLLIHGFGASPREMRPLGDMLLQHNFTVYGARLPGHGTTPADLATRTAGEWLATVNRNYQSLIDTGHSVTIVGLSTGALLTLKLALQQQPDKLILLAPFLKLKHRGAPFVSFLSYFIPYTNRAIIPTERPFYYQQLPLKGIAQINKLCQQLRHQLALIKTPTLTLTSTGDATITTGTAENLHGRLGAKNKQFYCYGDNVPHVLVSDQNPCQRDVMKRCLNFLTTTG
ncbi:MAG: alpha/beta fold hydrolase [Desulfuromonadales bacterium]|nr:alpha/beta fold hydrolase [Desulfuromonadales bacterium]